MALDPMIQTMVDQSKAAGRNQSMAQGTVEEARQGYAMMRAIGGEEAPLASVQDLDADGIPIRVYTPEGDGPFPICIYFHGGGFTIGSIESHDPVTRRLASDAGVIVVSVEYRLAPEHPFPAAVDDAFAATKWIGAHAEELGGQAGKLAVAGDSAGGNLAAVVSLMARDAGGPALALQLLVYPTADSCCEHPSHVENAEGPFLTKTTMDWFYEQYKPEMGDWRVSPLHASDLSGLPAAHIITAGHDPLRDEGEAYGEALRNAGGTAVIHRYDTMPHVFLQMYGILPTARECMAEMAEALRKAFA